MAMLRLLQAVVEVIHMKHNTTLDEAKLRVNITAEGDKLSELKEDIEQKKVLHCYA
jgi:hypothetical protein